MDNTVEQRAYGKIKEMVKGPTISATMLLPEKVFLSFKFDKFVYIKHKDLRGYFFVERIDQYKDGVTPVRVDLLKID